VGETRVSMSVEKVLELMPDDVKSQVRGADGRLQFYLTADGVRLLCEAVGTPKALAFADFVDAAAARIRSGEAP
jgi:hypothetical protein